MADMKVYSGDKTQCTRCSRQFIDGQQIMVEHGGQGRVFCHNAGRDCATRYMLKLPVGEPVITVYGEVFGGASEDSKEIP